MIRLALASALAVLAGVAIAAPWQAGPGVVFVIAAAPSGTAVYWQSESAYTRLAARTIWLDSGALYTP